VLLVLANQDFYYREYSDTRRRWNSRAARAGRGGHANAVRSTRQLRAGERQRIVQPDLALADASASNYSAIVFVGGWGARSTSTPSPALRQPGV